MQMKEAKQARLAVVGALAVLILGGLLVAMSGWVEICAG